jgi:hypothetical protein
MPKNRLLGEILTEAESSLQTQERFNTVHSWRHLTKTLPDSAGTLVGVVCQGVKNFTMKSGLGTVEPRRGEHRGEFRRLTKADKPRPLAREDVLERVLVIGDGHLRNRFNFLSGLTAKEFDWQTKNMTVDIVRRADVGTIDVMYELKNGSSKDHPASAMLELVMYYLLYDQARKVDSGLPKLSTQPVLSVLAPQAYYTAWRGYARIGARDPIDLMIRGLIEGWGKCDGIPAMPEFRFDVVGISPATQG